MTSEVALMNRSAVALAADSAATITYWNSDKGQQEERYFKKANKIFNVISGKPVGMMAYAAGSLQGLPWDVLAKAFRDENIGHARDHLKEYATDLFSYLEANRAIFPEDGQFEQLLGLVSELAARIIFGGIITDAYKAEPDAQKKKQMADATVATIEADITAQNYINDTARDVCDAQVQEKKKVIDAFKVSELGKMVLTMFDEPTVEKIVELALVGTFKVRATEMKHSGVVVAGYGEKEYMPHLEQFFVYGVFGNKIIYKRYTDGCKSISFTNTSEIVPIAQSTMTHTFWFGADPSTIEEIQRCVDALVESKMALVAICRRCKHQRVLYPANFIERFRSSASS
jgi:hypothetical protein